MVSHFLVPSIRYTVLLHNEQKTNDASLPTVLGDVVVVGWALAAGICARLSVDHNQAAQ